MLVVVVMEEEDMDTHTDTDTAVLQHILLQSHRRMVVVAAAAGGGIAGHMTNTLLLPLPLLLLVFITWIGTMGHMTLRRQWTRSQRASLHVQGRNHHLHQMQIKWRRTCRK
jgi:hypothetical protein